MTNEYNAHNPEVFQTRVENNPELARQQIHDKLMELAALSLNYDVSHLMIGYMFADNTNILEVGSLGGSFASTGFIDVGTARWQHSHRVGMAELFNQLSEEYIPRIGLDDGFLELGLGQTDITICDRTTQPNSMYQLSADDDDEDG